MTTSQLKYTALIFMTIDHIGAFIPGTPIWLHYIGRLAAPIFFFVAVEGIMHTVNRKKYLLRLYISSVLMSAAEYVIETFCNIIVDNNIFASILFGTAIVYILEEFRDNRRKRNLLLLAFVCWQIVTIVLLGTFIYFDVFESTCITNLIAVILGNYLVGGEGAMYLTLAILLFYLLRDSKKRLALGYIAYCILFSALTVFKGATYCYEIAARLFNRTAADIFVRFPLFEVLGLPISGNILGASYFSLAFKSFYQWMMIFALPIILLYNGERGRYPKWLFYAYYPLHIFALALIGSVL